MGSKLEVLFEQIYSVLTTFGIFDLIDILLVAYLTYVLIKFIRETRAGQLAKGLLLLALCYFVASMFQLQTMSFLLENVFQIGILAIIVLFTPEIRRALEKAGRTKVADLSVFSADGHERDAAVWEGAVRQITEAVESLSRTKTGALIVIERKTKLGEQVDTGVELNAVVSVELLLNIFFVNTPLHDGAVIIRDGKLLAAACFLPKPQKEEFIATQFGSRHRAAIGISEVSDALTIVVSEETGTISVTEDGQMIRNFTQESLSTYLLDKLTPTKLAEEGGRKHILRRVMKK